MTEGKILPDYKLVDGFKLAACFSADCFRSGLKYKPQPDDFFIATFPKCGTTWTQQIVSLIQNKGKSAKNMMEFARQTPYLELIGVEDTERRVKPGTIKVHLPYNLTPMSEEAKYLYVVRNPKDTLVSFYHHTCSPVYSFQNGQFDDYFELFINGENDYGDYFDHVLSWYEHRNDQNVMFLTYEELKEDNVNSIMKIAKFMGDEYLLLLENNKEVFDDVLKHSSLKYMKGIFNDAFDTVPKQMKGCGADLSQIPLGLRCILEYCEKSSIATGSDKQFVLIRKGIVGDWRNNFNEDQARRMDEKIEARLKGTELYTYWKSIGCI